MTPDMRILSKQTWREHSPRGPAVPHQLRPPSRSVGWRERSRQLWQRHRIRRQRAEDYVASAFSPKRGLPVATSKTVVGFLRAMLLESGGLLALVIVANVLAAGAALAVPMLLGDLVDRVFDAGGRPPPDTVTMFVVAVTVILVAQAGFTFLAKWLAAVLGQGILARARERVIRTVLTLPLGRVESASTGDLVTRVTRDVGSMSGAVRHALPEFIVGITTVALTIIAMLLNAWALALPTLVMAGLAMIQVRTYLRRAPAAYLLEGATYSQINTTLSETLEGIRTVESFGLQEHRRQASIDDIEVSAQAERYGLTLRNQLFAVMDMAFSLPRILTLVLGAVLHTQGLVTIGQLTTAMLYIEAFYRPFDLLVQTVDRLQVGIASTTRLLGIAEVPPDREPGDDEPDHDRLEVRDVRYAYRNGHDVLHGIDLDLSPGERLAIVGPSGSGKSTLARLLAGIHGPRTGTVRVGDVDLMRLPLERLRSDVALVTQEHHVFRGTLRDNIELARDGSGDDGVWRALRMVGAEDWTRALPDGLGTRLGVGSHTLTPAQAQQVALARLILADPHTLVLDEATSLIDPRTARVMESSMSSLLTGRTVVAIAHRLHTAHDADRIAVVRDGRVVELGSHEELMDQGGEYAALWRAWTH